MKYLVGFKPRALRDLDSMVSNDRARIIDKIELMTENLRGDVKRLTNFTPEYRLRVGDYRILFEVEGEKLVIYRIKHRRESYR